MGKIKKASSIIIAILAALLFGVSAPLSKALLSSIQPTVLAALLYLGCGLGVLLFKLVTTLVFKNRKESRISKSDLPWLAGIILTGGVAAPIVLMFSLTATPAATASLLLNFEAIATSLLAAIFFKESLGRRVWAAVAIMTVAAMILTWSSSGEWGISIGAAGILGACLLWGVDNNLTRMVSLKDPLTITIVKGFGAGAVSLIISLCSSALFPEFKMIIWALVLGAFSYGISIVLFILSMRRLGAARTSAFFASAPFIGSMISIVVFGEIPALQFYISLPIMILGVVLIINEKHQHNHIHEKVQHDHKHVHDDSHHNHVHENGFTGEHSHIHTHEEMVHEHSHMPDIHHRHSHNKTAR